MDLHGEDEDHQHLEEQGEGRREPGREAPQVRRGLVQVPRAVRLDDSDVLPPVWKSTSVSGDPSSGGEPASPRRRAGVAPMAWKL